MSNGYNFTERVRKVLAMSRERAHELGHQYVGTEHLLLGLIRDGEGVATAVMQALGVDLEKVETLVLKMVKKGDSERYTGPDLPYTSRAKRVLELSMAEARDFSHSYVGTEHLLLGLLGEGKGIGAQALVENGLTLERAREETLRLLGNPDQLSSSSLASQRRAFFGESPKQASNPPGSKITAIFVEFHFDDGTTVRKEFANTEWAIKYLEGM